MTPGGPSVHPGALNTPRDPQYPQGPSMPPRGPPCPLGPSVHPGTLHAPQGPSIPPRGHQYLQGPSMPHQGPPRPQGPPHPPGALHPIRDSPPTQGPPHPHPKRPSTFPDPHTQRRHHVGPSPAPSPRGALVLDLQPPERGKSVPLPRAAALWGRPGGRPGPLPLVSLRSESASTCSCAGSHRCTQRAGPRTRCDELVGSVGTSWLSSGGWHVVGGHFSHLRSRWRVLTASGCSRDPGAPAQLSASDPALQGKGPQGEPCPQQRRGHQNRRTPCHLYSTDGLEAWHLPSAHTPNGAKGEVGAAHRQAGTVPCTGQERPRWSLTSFMHSASMNSNADRISPSIALQVRKVCRTSAKPGQPAMGAVRGQADWHAGTRPRHRPPEPALQAAKPTCPANGHLESHKHVARNRPLGKQLGRVSMTPWAPQAIQGILPGPQLSTVPQHPGLAARRPRRSMDVGVQAGRAGQEDLVGTGVCSALPGRDEEALRGPREGREEGHGVGPTLWGQGVAGGGL